MCQLLKEKKINLLKQLLNLFFATIEGYDWLRDRQPQAVLRAMKSTVEPYNPHYCGAKIYFGAALGFCAPKWGASGKHGQCRKMF